jgi:PTH2 family peptidyl-tRNA hydrolase
MQDGIGREDRSGHDEGYVHRGDVFYNSVFPNYSPGKIGAQCGHATLACYKHFLRHAPSSTILQRWERMGQAKVALQVKGEEELEILQAQAVSLGLVAHIIHDAGRTQIASGSATVLGIGPAPKGVIDQVTGHLKLL